MAELPSFLYKKLQLIKYKHFENKKEKKKHYIKFIKRTTKQNTDKTEEFKMAEKFADKLQKIEDGVVGTYKKIENGVTDAYQKVEDKFIDTFVAKEGETVAAAKERMLKNQETLDAKMKAEAEKRTQTQKEMIEKSIQAGKNAGKK